MSSLQYIIVVDFEATCFENQPYEPELRNSEIIEFPAVLYDLKNGQIKSIFHEYIRPIEKPKLSEYCLKLTGITQNMVDNGKSLNEVLDKFHVWLSKELKARNLILPKYCPNKKLGNCAFVTWTSYDFGTFLDLECKRKNIKKPEYFNQWIDLSKIFSRRHGNRRFGLAAALRRVGIQFVGKPHSGIDDAKNVAVLANKLISNGANLSINSDLTPRKDLNDNCF